MKTKITFTLDEYDAALLDQAVRRVLKLNIGNEATKPHHRSFLFRWMVHVVSAAIIRKGKLDLPFAVELRSETPEETRQRLAKKMPAGPDEPRGFPPFNRGSYPWN